MQVTRRKNRTYGRTALRIWGSNRLACGADWQSAAEWHSAIGNFASPSANPRRDAIPPQKLFDLNLRPRPRVTRSVQLPNGWSVIKSVQVAPRSDGSRPVDSAS